MKVKSSELPAGPALDWAVIVALHGRWDANNPEHVKSFLDLRSGHPLHQQARYCERWDHGGPILDTMIAQGFAIQEATFSGRVQVFRSNGDQFLSAIGETVLIAAMRCWVTFKLGAEVDVPDELFNTADERARVRHDADEAIAVHCQPRG
ncbi:MAG: hypothetical protein K0Q43_117 [Ramlibacter sp.]|jgi:hypothetical protein|nr:hypothetical protein [Ramlibacter sp.]